MTLMPLSYRPIFVYLITIAGSVTIIFNDVVTLHANDSYKIVPHTSDQYLIFLSCDGKPFPLLPDVSHVMLRTRLVKL